MKNIWYIIGGAIAVVLCIVLFIATTFFNSYKALQAKNTNLQERITVSEKPPTLPSNAVKLSECIPYEGEHWVVPQDLPNGPFYSSYNGKIVSIEYMFTADEIPGEEPAEMTQSQFMAHMEKNNYTFGDYVKNIRFGFDLSGYKYNSVDIHWSPPHSGFVIPHYDAHFFLLNEQELAKICPDAKIEDVYSPEIMQTIEEHNIPFPGLPQKK